MIVLMMMMTTTTMIIRDEDIIIMIMMLAMILMNMLQARSFCTIIRPYDHEILGISHMPIPCVFQVSSSVCSARLPFAPFVHSVLLRFLSRVRNNLLRVFVEASAVHLHPMFAYVTRKTLHTCISAPLNLALIQPYLRAGRARANPFFRPSAATAPFFLSVLRLRRRVRFAIRMCSCMICVWGRIRPSFVFGSALGVYACVRVCLLPAHCCVGGTRTSFWEHLAALCVGGVRFSGGGMSMGLWGVIPELARRGVELHLCAVHAEWSGPEREWCWGSMGIWAVGPLPNPGTAMTIDSHALTALHHPRMNNNIPKKTVEQRIPEGIL